MESRRQFRAVARRADERGRIAIRGKLGGIERHGKRFTNWQQVMWKLHLKNLSKIVV